MSCSWNDQSLETLEASEPSKEAAITTIEQGWFKKAGMCSRLQSMLLFLLDPFWVLE